MARLAARSGRSKDLEIIVLRHQVSAVRRQLNRPELTDSARSLLGAIASALPRPRRSGWLVPGSRYVDVADAGHMVAGDQNDRFIDAVLGFLTDLHPDQTPSADP